jgi:hypothetical protein
MATPTTPPPAADNLWADDILGFNKLRSASGKRTLEAEVDAYILDLQVGSIRKRPWAI